MWLLGLLWGCDTWRDHAPAPAPTDAVLEVIVSLDEAVDRAGQGDRDAVEAWVRAHDRFERDVEPALRSRHPRDVVAATEYRFSLIRQALDHGGDASKQVDALEARLQELFAAPPTNHPGPASPAPGP